MTNTYILTKNVTLPISLSKHNLKNANIKFEHVLNMPSYHSEFKQNVIKKAINIFISMQCLTW